MSQEVIDRYTNLINQFDSRVQAAPADSWGNQAPCEEWKARDVVGHVVGGINSIVGGLTDGEPVEMNNDDPVGSWNSAHDRALAAVSSSDLSKTVQGPFGPQPAEQVIGRLMCTDILVHTWDLARAVGGDEQLDADAVSGAYSGLKPMDAMIRMPGVFGPKVESPEGASEQTQFLNFLGRTVSRDVVEVAPATTVGACERGDGGIGIIFAVAALVAAGCTDDSGVSVEERTSLPDNSTDNSTEGTDTTQGSNTTDPVDVDAIEWGDCDDPEASDPELECATLTVPLDYDDPSGETIDITLVRAPATDDREGAVLFNPGGPGGSGFDPIANSGIYIQEQLGLEHFDVVGFDPRGVDRSNGIKCVDDEFQDTHLYLDDTPDTPEEEALLDEADTGFTEGCIANYGDTLQYYSTVNTARDMDLIRAGLGDEQLSFLGISYGTYLGGIYATLFPERVRAMVLDSAFEPSGDTIEEQYLTQLVGFENAFNDWAAWCEETPTCAFADIDVGQRWEELRLQLDENPLTVDGRGVNQSTLDRATTAALYAESEWPVLADALSTAEAGAGDGLLALADDYEGRNPDGTFNTLFQSIGIIRCASGMVTPPAEDPEALLEKIREQAPRFGRDTTLEDLAPEDGDVDGCAELMPAAELVQIDYSGSGPIVVVGGKNDPATPFRWAEEMTDAMGANARLLTFTGEGHGQLLVSECVTEIEAAVLADLELPDEGVECDPDPKVERPDWFDDLPAPTELGAPVSVAAVTGALGIADTFGYSEGYLTTLSLEDAVDLVSAPFDGSDYQYIDNLDLEIDGTSLDRYLTADNELLLVFVLGPEAFETDDLSSAAASVPDGQTVVMYVFVPQ